MITFHLQPSFRNRYRKYENTIYQLYEYIETVLKNPLECKLQVDFDLMSNQNQPFEYDAYTVIKDWNSNNFPAYSTIYMCPEGFQSKKHFYFTMLHELFHALGIMYLPNQNIRWSKLIDQEKQMYVGNGLNSKAIFYYSQFMHKKCKCIPLQIDDDSLTNFHHLTPKIKDVFSSPLHYNVSLVTLGLLEDYGYCINYEKKYSCTI